MKPKFNFYNIAIHLILIIFAALIIYLVRENNTLRKMQNNAIPKVVIGQQIDSLKVITPAGKDSSLSFVNSPKPVILIVYSYDCPHCHQVLPMWKEIAKSTGEKFEMVAVTMDSLQTINAFVKEAGIPFKVFQTGKRILQKHSLVSFPTTIVMKKGVVEKAWNGELSLESFNELKGYIRQH